MEKHQAVSRKTSTQTEVSTMIITGCPHGLMVEIVAQGNPSCQLAEVLLPPDADELAQRQVKELFLGLHAGQGEGFGHQLVVQDNIRSHVSRLLRAVVRG